MLLTISCGSGHHLDRSAGLTIVVDELFSSLTVKNLGVLFDGTLSMEDHVNRVC